MKKRSLKKKSVTPEIFHSPLEKLMRNSNRPAGNVLKRWDAN